MYNTLYNIIVNFHNSASAWTPFCLSLDIYIGRVSFPVAGEMIYVLDM
jgi:hypothetical protein